MVLFLSLNIHTSLSLTAYIEVLLNIQYEIT